MKIRCVITDDEPVARKGLQGYVEKISFLQLDAMCKTALELNDYLAANETDLLFLDIEMPFLTGIEMLSNLSKPPKVVFTTAYDKYAVKAYELEVIDYLLKPITFDRFLKSANKAAEIFREVSPDSNPTDFFIKCDGKFIRLLWDEVLFIEGRENYISIQTASAKYMTQLTMKSVAEKMPAHFIQVHKSSIVNGSAVTGIDGNMLILGLHLVLMSRTMKEEALERLLKNKLLKK